MNIPVETHVTAVTVFPDRARVTCSGQVSLEEGKQRLIIPELPLSLEPESLRAAGRGSAQVRLLSVDVRSAFYEETPAEKVSMLEKEVEELEDRLQLSEDEEAVQEAQARYLEGLRQSTKQYAQGLARGRTTVADQAALGQFLLEQDRSLHDEIRRLQQEKRQLNRQLDKVRRELEQHQSARPRQRYQAEVEVETLSTGDFQLLLTYVVGRAGWSPLYDVRLSEVEGRNLMAVTTLAQITQSTGQDWVSIDLTVSTARPATSQRLPELQPWFLDIYRPPITRAKAAAPAAVPMAAMTLRAPEPEGQMAILADASPEYAAEPVMAQAQTEGATITYRVAGSSDVPSDGSPHKTTLNQQTIEPDLDYLAIPKQTSAVFRRIKTKNIGPSPMLSGHVNLFYGDEYIGHHEIDYVPVGDEIELHYGVEERITVDRELVRRDVDKAFLRDKRQLLYGYKIELNNLLASEAKIEVQDHIPLTRHEDIKVRIDSIVPDPAERSDMNLLEWHLNIPPGEKRILRYEFQIQHPRDQRILGLMD